MSESSSSSSSEKKKKRRRRSRARGPADDDDQLSVADDEVDGADEKSERVRDVLSSSRDDDEQTGERTPTRDREVRATQPPLERRPQGWPGGSVDDSLAQAVALSVRARVADARAPVGRRRRRRAGRR